MECRDIRVCLTAYIDEALTVEEREAVERHISGCEGCSTFLAMELRTKRLLQQRLPHPKLPPTLRERIMNGIARAQPGKQRRLLGIPSWLLRPTPILATAAAFVLLLGLTIFYAGARRIEASPFVRDSVDGHVKCLLGEYTMEVKLANPAELSRWFQERLRFPVRLPRFVTQEPSHLWEGRVSLMGGVRSAQVFYRWKGKTLSLFVLPGEKIALMPGEVWAQNRRTFHVNHHKGHTSLMWRDGDLTYCLVSDLSPEEVMAFASEQHA